MANGDNWFLRSIQSSSAAEAGATAAGMATKILGVTPVGRLAAGVAGSLVEKTVRDALTSKDDSEEN
jgi:hypothetical protein